MSVVTLVLVFLLAVVVSVFVSRLLKDIIPLPLIQIALGAGLSLYGFTVEFEPHLFLFLFIPPLLFLDGWRIPKEALFQEIKPIMSLAIGLVVVTVIGMGFFIHWLIPAISLAVAFALAAILSPTDPVSVSAMTVNSPLPSRMAHILEGESLLNDATGLVCFSFAVVAALTGTFSLASAAGQFVLVAFGGILIGLLVAWAIGWLNQLLVKRTGEEPAIQIMISLLMPFTAYLLAEHLHVSGILAAVVAGIAMHYEKIAGRMQAATRMQSKAVWDTVQTALNGMIFILLGEQLPGMWTNMPAVAEAAGASHPWMLFVYVVIITVALAVLRFSWVWISMTLTVFHKRRRGKEADVMHIRMMAVMATAGVRGAITLAGILTLPLLMPDGSLFPNRDVAIFLAMGVILCSLLIASIALPILTKGLVQDLPYDNDEIRARLALNEAAMAHLRELMNHPSDDMDEIAMRTEVGAQLLEIYGRRLDNSDETESDVYDLHKMIDMEREMSKSALKAKRDALYQMRKSKNINERVYHRLRDELDLKEETLNHHKNGKH
ncbi:MULTISPECIES: Na+/H+ antiporter [Providencia]|uniref:Sodium, potassium, lithium and rubidium/H(+) antiporter n=1 Tax=Providencia rettgeri TaxID=587 RepID=A0A379FLC5_PRORE|nr:MULTISPECIES: Na+/H+ antiporter [Providencia]EJF7710126.1 Na+/H+ antiporter [Providencia rettgeri]MCX9110765.1 Na+/H+ antiporter [Providencia rettgeri]MCX9118651.1 Na+/H+ antiporter [Providencia rettgeri]MDH2366524.1 Na+/H+ antiporter [Providencia rettgeri]QXB06516.1 Na+/H+ antiporter [Providencia rettgeri]